MPLATAQVDASTRYTPVLRAAERRLADLPSGQTVTLSTAEYEKALRHAVGLVKALLDATAISS